MLFQWTCEALRTARLTVSVSVCAFIELYDGTPLQLVVVIIISLSSSETTTTLVCPVGAILKRNEYQNMFSLALYTLSILKCIAFYVERK